MIESDNPHAYVEFYRRDLGSISRRILIPAGVMVFLGAPATCFGLAIRGSVASHFAVGIPGVIVLVGGLLLGFLGMARLVGEEAYVGVVQDGLVVKSKTAESYYAWADLGAIKAEASALVLTKRDSDDLIRVEGNFGGLSPTALAERLEDWRRKSGWKLTPSDPPKK
jgi:hypothetical protein